MSTRNVLNAREVARFVADLAQETDKPELQRWLESAGRRWILIRYDLVDRIVRDPATGGPALVRPDSQDDVVPRAYAGAEPAWCRAALERGEAVIAIRIGATLRKRLRRAMALLEGELERGGLTALDRLTFEAAEARVGRRRRDRFVARREARVARGTRPIFPAGEGGVVQLTSRDSLAHEGARMHHCVGGYGYPEAVARGECEIYSLRDRTGRPRATLEVEDGRVLQVQGFANGPVRGVDRVVLRAFIRGRGYEIARDRHNLRLLRRDFRCEASELDRRLRIGGGLELLRENRLAALGAPAYSEIKALLCQVIANADRLDAETLAGLYAATRPERGRLLRLRPSGRYRAYGLALRLYHVALPMPFLNLARCRVFRGTPWEREARDLLRRAEDDLANLALTAPKRLYALGPQPGAGWQRHRPWDCPADLLAEGRIDVSALRDRRHLALRRTLNRAKTRTLGRRAKPAKGHLALRRLLDAPERNFVL